MHLPQETRYPDVSQALLQKAGCTGMLMHTHNSQHALPKTTSPIVASCTLVARKRFVPHG
jgi:hypothetical protein